MERVLEPELMDDPAQALAYSRADFEEENQGFVDRFAEFYPEFKAGHVLDLGCGEGELLAWLAENKGVEARGVEISATKVRRAIARASTAFRCEKAINIPSIAKLVIKLKPP